MKYQKLLLLGLLMFGMHGCIGVAPGGQGYTINVPMSMLNTTIRQNFPRQQKTNYGILVIDKPNILGRTGSNKLGIGTSFSFSNILIPQGVKGVISLSSGIRYNPSDRGLYLTNSMIDELKFQNFSLSAYITPQIRYMIRDVIMQQLANKPIYHINTGASFVKNVRVQNGNILVTLGL